MTLNMHFYKKVKKYLYKDYFLLDGHEKLYEVRQQEIFLLFHNFFFFFFFLYQNINLIKYVNLHTISNG